MSTDDIYNFIRIDYRVATAGQPTAEQLSAVRDDGYQVVVNLAPVDERTEAIDEATVVPALGMAYHHLPVPWDDPRPEHFAEFVLVCLDGTGRQVAKAHSVPFRLDDDELPDAGWDFAIRSGLRPSMLELMDRASVNAVEDSRRMGLDREAGALLVAQSDAPGTSRGAEVATMEEQCRARK